MTQPGAFILSEIGSQGDTWQAVRSSGLQKTAAIRSFFAPARQVIFSGCGSALNSSYASAPAFQEFTGISARAVAAADLYLYPDSILIRSQPAVAVLSSRSGRTTEVINALETLKQRAIPVMGITCDGDSPLSRRSDLAWVLDAANERAVATTRSVSAMILSGLLLAAIVSGKDDILQHTGQLPAAFQQCHDRAHTLGKQIADRPDIHSFAILGNGHLYGYAREVQLKIKEMTLLSADSYPMLEFRHGPKARVNPHMLVVVMMGETARKAEITFLKDMKALGGITFTLCDAADAEIIPYSDYLLKTQSNLGEWVNGLLYLPALQYLAAHRSLALGMNPDEPENLSYWVQI